MACDAAASPSGLHAASPAVSLAQDERLASIAGGTLACSARQAHRAGRRRPQMSMAEDARRIVASYTEAERDRRDARLRRVRRAQPTKMCFRRARLSEPCCDDWLRTSNTFRTEIAAVGTVTMLARTERRMPQWASGPDTPAHRPVRVSSSFIHDLVRSHSQSCNSDYVVRCRQRRQDWPRSAAGLRLCTALSAGVVML
jgi:hypothetical protein